MVREFLCCGNAVIKVQYVLRAMSCFDFLLGCCFGHFHVHVHVDFRSRERIEVCPSSLLILFYDEKRLLLVKTIQDRHPCVR